MNAHPISSSTALPAAVLWDFDGTLVDTEPFWISNEHRLTEELGGQWSDELAKANIGNSLIRTGRSIRLAAGRDDLTDEQVTELLVARVLEDLRVADLEWRPGVPALLADLREAGIPCALVSASFREMLVTVLDRLDDSPFAVVVGGDDVTHGKPHPEPYLTAAAQLGVRPEDCLVIEDSLTGADSGNSAGCVVAVVPNVVTPPPAERRVLLETLSGVRVAELRALMSAELVR
ncbi:HAD family hydrolase [Granulicoccus sp. GXG6511]|uniref:HAD family hydrolase n=1 Tax=Granulicoccus sp. GXG6511 TaxID=3381351 RepID=UPI003D7E4F9F